MPDENTSPLSEDEIELEEGEGGNMVVGEIQMPENFIYSNLAGIGFTQLDFRITFAEILPNGKYFTRAGIVMPPEHAAGLALVLLGHVRVYEERFGPIRLKQWQDQKARALAAMATISKPKEETPE